MVCSNSLAGTLDALNETFFYGRPLSGAQAEEVARRIAGRQVKSGAWAGSFAPAEYDHQEGVRLFTGERLRTRLAARNVLTAEAARALVLLDVAPDDVQGTRERAGRWLLEQCFSCGCVAGECAHSTVGLMRYLAAGGSGEAERRLNAHIVALFQRRDGKGRWQGFPFYYTLLALAETGLPLAVEEMRYARPACERALKRPADGDPFHERRRAVVQRVLNS